MLSLEQAWSTELLSLAAQLDVVAPDGHALRCGAGTFDEVMTRMALVVRVLCSGGHGCRRRDSSLQPELVVWDCEPFSVWEIRDLPPRGRRDKKGIFNVGNRMVHSIDPVSTFLDPSDGSRLACFRDQQHAATVGVVYVREWVEACRALASPAPDES